jgi:hypothetical protein
MAGARAEKLIRRWCLTVVAVMALACSGGSSDGLGAGGGTPTASLPPESGPLMYLDAETLSLVQPIEPADMTPGRSYKFVQVEIVEVMNPKRQALSFQVHYQRGDNEPTHLGNFSLYPADHPGRFIVPTHGIVHGEGAIVLTLTSPDPLEKGDSIRVGVRRMRFLEP